MRYSFKLLLIALVSLPVGILIVSVAPFDRKGRLAYALSRLWTGAVLRIGGVRLRVQGLERLDSRRPYIFMANHQSNIDIPALVQALPQFQLRWIAKKELLYVPVFGWALWASRHIIVDRSNLSKAMTSLRKAREKIAGGISVVIFPEGTRSVHGQFLPFKRGGFVLAVQSGTPIVPVTINGTEAILPKGDWRIRGGDVEVVVSEAISVEQYHPANLQQLLSRVRTIMESHYRRTEGSADDGLTCAQAALLAETLAEKQGVRWNH